MAITIYGKVYMNHGSLVYIWKVVRDNIYLFFFLVPFGKDNLD